MFPQYVETAVVPRAEILKTEVEWLHSIRSDFVVINFFFSYNQSISATLLGLLLCKITMREMLSFVTNRCLMLSLSRAVQRLMLGYVLSVSPISGDIFLIFYLSVLVCLVLA